MRPAAPVPVPTPQESRLVLKKVVVLLVVAFAVYYLLTSPGAAADSVRGAFDAVMEAFNQVRLFFERLVG
ncbi:MAG: hypothetical protein Q7T56_03545 [Nocardioidaceae bacterium]|nr:hypothetical protein [Nocardioidaceae bacterium]